MLAAEEAAAAGTVVRLAGLYDLERGPHSYWLKVGTVKGAPEGLINLVHYDARQTGREYVYINRNNYNYMVLTRVLKGFNMRESCFNRQNWLATEPPTAWEML